MPKWARRGMQAPARTPIFYDVTAVAAHPWARPQAAVAPVARDSVRGLMGTLHEPNLWTVGIVVATGLVIAARHPIARMLGTEVAAPPAPVVATAPPAAHTSPLAPALAAPLLAAPTHAPR